MGYKMTENKQRLLISKADLLWRRNLPIVEHCHEDEEFLSYLVSSVKDMRCFGQVVSKIYLCSTRRLGTKATRLVTLDNV